MHWAFSLGGLPEQNSRCAETVQNLRIIATRRRSLKTEADFRHTVSYRPANVSHMFFLAFGPLGTPFMIVRPQ